MCELRAARTPPRRSARRYLRHRLHRVPVAGGQASVRLSVVDRSAFARHAATSPGRYAAATVAPAAPGTELESSPSAAIDRRLAPRTRVERCGQQAAALARAHRRGGNRTTVDTTRSARGCSDRGDRGRLGRALGLSYRLER